MKILITGANGMLAKAVRERFKEEELILTDVAELDITNLKKVEEFVFDANPDVIINCAAYTAVDKAEEDVELARKINAEGPKNLAIAAKKSKSTLVHISTDYVFGGNLPLEETYKEEDKKEPETVYGITKLEGEEAIKENTENYYIFRTAWLYGDGKNFVRTMLRLGKENGKVGVVADQYGSPTYAVDLADIIHQALTKKIPYGIYHTTNLGFMSWFDFTKAIFKIANLPYEVKPLATKDFPTPAKRPANSKLSKDKLLQAGINVPGAEDAIKRYLKEEKVI